MERYLKGSNWARWDLHVHTPCSRLNTQFGDYQEEEAWNEYIFKLFSKAKENEIVCIGITDYFSIEGYSKVKNILGDDNRLKSIFKDNIELINYAKSILLQIGRAHV